MCTTTFRKGVWGVGYALVGACLAVGAVPARGQCVQEQKLTALDAGALDSFGYSMSLSGNVAIVGALGDDCAEGPNCGSAYVFRFNGTNWAEEQKLTASDPAANDYFGNRVALSGNVALVGAFYDDTAAGADSGSAYVFRFNGSSWFQEQKLTASDAAPNASFGSSVSLNGNVAIVGALGDDCADGTDCGSAYVFRFNGTNWAQEQKLTASDAAAIDGFGASIAVSGDVAVVGAQGDDCAAGGDCGSAYVFRFNDTNWVQEQKLTASDGAGGDNFGNSVSINGNVAVVAAAGDNGVQGSAYVFRFNGSSWAEEQKLTASDGAGFDVFGFSLSATGDVAVVGAPNVGCVAGGQKCGSVYIFRFNGTNWIQEQKLTASDVAAFDQFGYAVTVSGDTVTVGAAGDSCAAGEACGSAYVFQCIPLCTPPDCNNHGTCDNGSCVCDTGYAGAACDQCRANYYNYPTCTFCQAATTCSGNGVCNSQGSCLCDSGWAGPDCAAPLGTCCISNGSCEAAGNCRENITPSECQTLGGRFLGPNISCAEACVNGACIPTVSTWGIIVLLLLLTTAGSIVLACRRVPSR